MGEGIGFEQPETVENKGIADELGRVLESVPPKENYPPDRELQRSILDQLPENLVEELHAHLIVVEGGKEAESPAKESKLRGELFESLAPPQ